MLSVSERNFHLVMGGVFFGSIVVEEAMTRILPAWNPPRLGFVAFIVGLVWIGRYAAWRAELQAEAHRVLEDRQERMERRLAALEEAEVRRNTDPLRGGGLPG